MPPLCRRGINPRPTYEVLRGVYTERYEILRYAQNDKGGRAQNDRKQRARNDTSIGGGAASLSARNGIYILCHSEGALRLRSV